LVSVRALFYTFLPKKVKKLREQVALNSKDSTKKIVVNIGNSKRVSQIAAQLQKKFFQSISKKLSQIIIDFTMDMPVTDNIVS